MAFDRTQGSCTEAPLWLSALENRIKRPHKLAHDVGAGSPCLVCQEKCKGLNLHFWRKICIECKCRKEDHDFIDEDEYAQFEILFGAKRVKKTTIKYNTHNKTFDWIPQNASQELIVDYLNALPQSKIPVTNTEGAAYRKQQLVKQLPLHDVNPKACHDLSEKEIINFRKYIENLKKNVIGQGKIMKMTPKSKESTASAAAGDVSTSHVIGNLKSPYGILVRDVQAGMKTIFSEKMNITPFRTEDTCAIDFTKEDTANSEARDNSTSLEKFFGSETIDSNIINQVPLSSVTQKMWDLDIESSKCYPTSRIIPFVEVKKQWKSNNGDDIVPRLELEMASEFVGAAQPADNENNVTVDPLKDDNGNGRFLNSRPCDSVKNEIERVMAMTNSNNADFGDLNIEPCAFPNVEPASPQRENLKINVMCNSSSEVPFSPLQESYLSKVEAPGKHHVANQPKPELPLPVNKQSECEEQKCAQCRNVLMPSDVVVTTDRGGYLKLWHAKCFVCNICRELLVDLMYFYHKGKVYCGRDYATVMNIPRCFACDELIFVKEYTQAEGESYHIRHFCCFECDEPLAGKQYVQKHNQPVCLRCYQDKYGKSCSTCLKPIAVDEQRVSWGELNFHVNPACFCCKNCLKSLVAAKFVIKNEKTFCSKDCVQQFIESTIPSV